MKRTYYIIEYYSTIHQCRIKYMNNTDFGSMKHALEEIERLKRYDKKLNKKTRKEFKVVKIKGTIEFDENKTA